MTNVAVLGCGPAGLMAAHAARLHGCQFNIYSRKNKSQLGGAQFLHKKIPGLTGLLPESTIRYVVYGDANTYRQKVYRDNEFVEFVSFEHVKDRMEVTAWNLRMAYDILWDRYEEKIEPANITPKWIMEMLLSDTYDLVVSTIPARFICMSHAGLIRDIHHFSSQTIKIFPEAITEVGENTIYYDGTKDHSWYRCSNLWGIGQTEFPSHVAPLVSPLIEVSKPVWTDCDCFLADSSFYKMGRYGSWKKGALTHDAYYGVVDALHELQ
jgi:hypothetical protein